MLSAHRPFPELFRSAPVILGEGAVIERLRRDAGVPLDPLLVNSALVYDPAGRTALTAIDRQYLRIGRQFDLPLFLSTPTWRANRERIEAAGLSGRDVNGDNFRMLDELRRECGEYAGRVVISGLMSCRGDAYHPEEALSVTAAEAFHAWQADALAAAGVDLLLASTLPALSEAMGLARAMSATGLPYLVSFVVRPEGTLLDGTPLREAIPTIDAAPARSPLAFLINCTHASFCRQALEHEENSSPLVRERVVGLLANTAPLTPEELDNAPHLVEEEPRVFGRTVAALHRDLGMKILGGCCGTDDRHIRALAQELAHDA